MEHKEYEKDIGGERAQEQEVVQDVDSERVLPIPKNVGDALQAKKEYKTKKVERRTDDLPHSCVTSGESGDGVANSLAILICAIPNGMEPQHRSNCGENAINEYCGKTTTRPRFRVESARQIVQSAYGGSYKCPVVIFLFDTGEHSRLI